MLFKDSKRDQFFNIVLSGEDDRNNDFKTKLAEYQDRIKKLKADSPQKNKDAIQIFKSEVQRMIAQHQFEVDSGNLVLQQDQLIYTPRSIGLQNIAVTQKRVVYISNFENGDFPDFMPGVDNITSIKRICDVAVAPMIDYENEVNGLFYFYNSMQGSLSLNTIKKMKAAGRLLGGFTQMVDSTAEQLMIKVGLFLKMEYLERVTKQKEADYG